MFSTIGHKEEQFEKMRSERKIFESMKGEQIAWFNFFIYFLFFCETKQRTLLFAFSCDAKYLINFQGKLFPVLNEPLPLLHTALFCGIC